MQEQEAAGLGAALGPGPTFRKSVTLRAGVTTRVFFPLHEGDVVRWMGPAGYVHVLRGTARQSCDGAATTDSSGYVHGGALASGGELAVRMPIGIYKLCVATGPQRGQTDATFEWRPDVTAFVVGPDGETGLDGARHRHDASDLAGAAGSSVPAAVTGGGGGGAPWWLWLLVALLLGCGLVGCRRRAQLGAYLARRSRPGPMRSVSSAEKQALDHRRRPRHPSPRHHPRHPCRGGVDAPQRRAGSVYGAEDEASEVEELRPELRAEEAIEMVAVKLPARVQEEIKETALRI